MRIAAAIYIGSLNIDVNEINNVCSPSVFFFSDGVKIFRKIKFASDSDVLQNDLKLLAI